MIRETIRESIRLYFEPMRHLWFWVAVVVGAGVLAFAGAR